MRRILLGGLTAAMLVIAPSANAADDPIALEHYAPVPCAVACAYWEIPDAAGFNECAQPFPAGSYDETIMRLTATTGVVHIRARSTVDYDTFICTNTEPRVNATPWGDCVGDCGDCRGVAGVRAIAVGCEEQIDLTWNWLEQATGGASDEFVIVSYNWSDYAPLPITITGPAEVVDDTYDATAV